jgi:septum formation protein
LAGNRSLWIGAARLVLASKSESRRLLLESAGLDVDVAAAAIDERELEREFLTRGGDPAALAAALAKAKALAVSASRPETLCLAADQTLLLDGKLFHKAANFSEAARNLRALSGRTHVLISAACVARAGEILFETSQNAFMTMRVLEDAAIERYLATAGHAVLSSVGAYQVEGLGIHLFEAIDGAHPAILGLPLLPLLNWFRAQGFLGL